MRLTIIIVNYNVKYFLEHCLYSIRKATGKLKVDIIVVDNNSTDNSISYLQSKFHEVKFIVNETNTGFASACNQGLQFAKGDLVLFLNPDTLLAEDTLEKCTDFFQSHPDCGALGVHMMDGSGKFLNESKRSFPSPMTALFKLFGLSLLFPRSRLFSRYHLGHIDQKQTHAVDVLAGAFMMIRKNILDKTGGFDEAFFMYGEDIDLSFRIQQLGYRNFYFAGTSIIHFKGESTKRGSLNYVRMFYKAMSIFVRKHYGETRAGIFNVSIHVAIWIRALLAALHKMLKWTGLLFFDALLLILSFWIVKEFWIRYVRPQVDYPDHLLLISFPAFTILYLVVSYYAGLYDRVYRNANLIRSTLIATIVLLAIYALLPEELRFSRGIVVFGALLGFLLISLVRGILFRMNVLNKPADHFTKPYLLIVAGVTEFEQVQKLLQEKKIADKILGRIYVNGDESNSLSGLNDLLATAKSLQAQEIIFCPGHELSIQRMMQEIQKLEGLLRVRFFAGFSIIGSDDKTSRGEILTTEADFRLAHPANRRLKRLIDVGSSFMFLLTFPLHIILIKKATPFFKNCFHVFLGKKTWVGYVTGGEQLPSIRPCIVGSNGVDVQQVQRLPIESLQLLDFWYAHDYEPLEDIRIMWKNYNHLSG